MNEGRALEVLREESRKALDAERRHRRIAQALLITSCFVLSASVLVLAVTVVRLIEALDRERGQSDCYDRLTGLVTVAGQQSDALQNSLFIDIARFIGGELSEDPLGPEHMSEVGDGLEASDAARIRAIERRAQWMADGRPLPCPVTAEGVLVEITIPALPPSDE